MFLARCSVTRSPRLKASDAAAIGPAVTAYEFIVMAWVGIALTYGALTCLSIASGYLEGKGNDDTAKGR